MLKFAPINVNSAGDNTLIAAVPNKYLRVLAFGALCDSNVTLTFKSGASTAITGPMPCLASGGLAPSIGQLGTGGYGTFGLFQTQPGEALVLNLSAAAQVGGYIAYYEIGQPA